MLSQRYGTDLVTIGLRVQDNTGGKIFTSIKVQPRVGSISLVSDPLVSCLFIVANTSSILSSSFLNATTNFSEQNPVITYDITTPPMSGQLERFIPFTQQWLALGELAASRGGLGAWSFTQDDINNDYVRYRHTAGDVNLDSFQFQLHSTNFTGPSARLCIHILSVESLVQPEIKILVNPVTLSEGERAVVNESIMEAVLTPDDFVYALVVIAQVDLEQTGVVYQLVTPPSNGHLEVRGQEVSSGEDIPITDIQGGVVYYHHSGSENHSDTFTVVARATAPVDFIQLPLPSGETVVNMTISPVNDNAPEFDSDNMEPIQVTEGSFARVTTANIDVTDVDLPEVDQSIYLRKPRANKPRVRIICLPFVCCLLRYM